MNAKSHSSSESKFNFKARGPPDTPRPWVCEVCSFPFKSKGNLLEHIRFYHMKGNVPCNYCDRTFLTSVYLRKHMKEHAIEKNQCFHCRAKLSNEAYAFEIHLEVCKRRPKRPKYHITSSKISKKKRSTKKFNCSSKRKKSHKSNKEINNRKKNQSNVKSANSVNIREKKSNVQSASSVSVSENSYDCNQSLEEERLHDSNQLVEERNDCSNSNNPLETEKLFDYPDESFDMEDFIILNNSVEQILSTPNIPVPVSLISNSYFAAASSTDNTYTQLQAATYDYHQSFQFKDS